MALKYRLLTRETQDKIEQDRKNAVVFPWKARNCDAIRRNSDRDAQSLWRPSYVRDIEKILHCPYYNRYADKTQVFSFYRNDDITRRALHVQLVSRIARNLGAALGLNLDLIEAISLGHDIGHTPFGHAGERFLSEILKRNTGRAFNHNVQSVRVLDRIFSRNLSLQVLDGIVCHNGELAQGEYLPRGAINFSQFDECMARLGEGNVPASELAAFTLEGCVVRVCDIIAYIGKDRQDAERAKLPIDFSAFAAPAIGATNAQIINNMSVDIIENSYGKNYIKLSDDVFADLKASKKQNYSLIYNSAPIENAYSENIQPMFEQIYEKLLSDLISKNKSSVIFKHHIDFVADNTRFYENYSPYIYENPNDIVCDYISSMTDNYFLDLYDFLFPNSKHHVDFVSYFEKLKESK